MRPTHHGQSWRVGVAVAALVLLSGAPGLQAASRHLRAAKHHQPASRIASARIPAPPAALTAQYDAAQRREAEAYRREMAAFWAYMHDVTNGDLRVDYMNKESEWQQARTDTEEIRLQWVHAQETKDHLVCPLCRGTGFMICPQCAGMGSGMSMFGHPGVRCLYCKGLGKVKCAECQGTGFVKPDKTADHRSYNGAHHFARCPHCINGKIPIMAYDKMEDMECPFCNGTGRIWE